MISGLQIILIFVAIYLAVVCYDRIRDWIDGQRKGCQQQPSDQPLKITPKMLQEAMAHRRFGTFTLPPAVVVFKIGSKVPVEGYRVQKSLLPNGRCRYQVTVAASAEKILDLFDALLMCLGEYCHVVVQDFGIPEAYEVDYFAFQKDMVIVRSIFYDFEELLLNDGFMGLAVYNEAVPAEVQLTQHKIIQIFALDLKPFRQVLNRYRIEENPELKFLFEDFHLHLEKEDDRIVLQSLKERLGVEFIAKQSGDFDAVYN
jgi:hypothetical protein